MTDPPAPIIKVTWRRGGETRCGLLEGSPHRVSYRLGRWTHAPGATALFANTPDSYDELRADYIQRQLPPDCEIWQAKAHVIAMPRNMLILTPEQLFALTPEQLNTWWENMLHYKSGHDNWHQTQPTPHTVLCRSLRLIERLWPAPEGENQTPC